VAINDVLPPKAARRDAIANLKCLWGFGHQRPNFDGYIYIHYAAPPYSEPVGYRQQPCYAIVVGSLVAS